MGSETASERFEKTYTWRGEWNDQHCWADAK